MNNNYACGTITRVEPVHSGYLSTNWNIFTDQNSFFLKEYRPALSFDHVTAIHETMKLFGEAGITVINPLLSLTGNTVITYNNRLYSLFPFVDGKLYHRPELTPDMLSALGTMLAKIHRHGTTLSRAKHLPVFRGWDRAHFFEHTQRIKELLSTKKTRSDFDEEAAQAIDVKLSHALQDSREPGDFIFTDYVVMHGDFHEHNVFFGEDDTITHVFDWEKTAYGPRAFELVRSLYLICISLPGISPEEALERAKIVFTAYQKTFPLSETEFKTAVEFYYVDQFYAVWIERLHYFENITKADKLLTESIEHIVFLERYREDFIQKMLE